MRVTRDVETRFSATSSTIVDLMFQEIGAPVALFPRRQLQRILDENACFLTPKQLGTACNLLNDVHDNYLATEWEQAILNAASNLGTVDHEPALGGDSRADLLFRGKEQSLEFIADITTASDRGLNKLNPVDALDEELWQRLRKANLLTGGIDRDVDAYPNNIYRGSKERVRLKLPPRREFDAKIFNVDFYDFLRRIKAEPETKHRHDVVGPDVGVHFTYDPARRGTGGGGHPSFTVANIIDQNPVYHALKAKGDQLKAAGYSGIAGIFLCDGGCHMLRSTMSHCDSYTVDQIIRYFFRQFDSVTFVTTFVVREDSWPSYHRTKRWLEPKFYVNPWLKIDSTELAQTITKIHASLPRPECTPENAMYHLRDTKGTCGRYMGVLQMGGNVKMSARRLLELLAGKKTIQDFEKDFALDHTRNPFNQMLAQGKLISSVTIEHHAEKDDDTVTIEFGQPDPAVSPFRVKDDPLKPLSTRPDVTSK